jgi:hypothetical protein
MQNATIKTNIRDAINPKYMDLEADKGTTASPISSSNALFPSLKILTKLNAHSKNTDPKRYKYI